MVHFKKIIKSVIFTAVAAAAVGAGVWYLTQPEEVDVFTADTGTISPVLSMTGNIMGDKKMTIYADVDGVIETRNFEIGERVHSGDLLLTYNGRQ